MTDHPDPTPTQGTTRPVADWTREQLTTQLLADLRRLRPPFQQDYPVLAQLTDEQRLLVDRFLGDALTSPTVDHEMVRWQLDRQLSDAAIFDQDDDVAFQLQQTLQAWALACLVDELLAERGYFPADLLGRPPAHEQEPDRK
jgi:hypothetical protein